MKLLRILIVLILSSCTTSSVTNVNPAGTIDDTFFYNTDGTYLQYPKVISIGDSCNLTDSWFGEDTFFMVVKDDKSSPWVCDTQVYHTDNDDDTEINCGYSNFIILKAYTKPDKSRFKFSKEIK